MKTIQIFILCFILTFGHQLLAQTENKTDLLLKRNNINFNMFGDASLISVNYERLFDLSPSIFLSGSIGAGYNAAFSLCFLGCGSKPKRFLTLPHHFTVNFGKDRDFFELGIGGTIMVGNTSEHYFLYPMLGFRVQPNKSGKGTIRLYGSVPFTGIDTEDIFWVPIGISIGRYF